MRCSSGTFLRGIVAWFVLLPTTVWTSPTLTRLEPASGPARSLVTIEGAGDESVRVIWDVGKPSQKVIATNLGATLFSVPGNATPGMHPVALEDDSGMSAPVDFMVTGDPLMMGAPRIDSITLVDAQFDEGAVWTLLYIQGANFDVGSVVKIDDTEVATKAHKAIATNFYGVPQAAFGNPIHHYLSLVAVPAPAAPGSEISVVVVRDADGVPSVPVTYTLPASPQALDSDRDSLPDEWELAGHDQNGDGVNDADPYRRDIFVELDIMLGLRYPLPMTGGVPDGVAAVKDMFRAAPILNPFGDNGINLMIDASGTVPAWDTVIFDYTGATGNPPDGVTSVAFSALKAAHFGHAALGDVYHYIVWSRRQLGGGSGQSDVPWPVSDLQPGDDVLISLDDLALAYQTSRSRAEILAHEIGHNLGQTHGGSTYERYNPNYFSVMSYTWALRTGVGGAKRRIMVTCLPFYYAQAGADEPLNTVPPGTPMVVDYSAGMADQVDEDALAEATGVCNHTVDWNEDGKEDGPGTPSLISHDANENKVKHEKIDDFANWPSLLFDGPVRNGTLRP